MKYLLVLLVVVIAISIWRGKRRVTAAAPGKPAAPAPQHPQSMVACAQCGLHLPLTDAITDAQGHAFCCTEHRTAMHNTSGH